MKIHHIGYLVKDIAKAVNKFEKLGYICNQDVVYDSIRDVNITFIKNGDYVVELVAPQSPASVVAELYKKFRNTPYHICYETADLDRDVATLQQDGFVLINTPAPAIAFGNRRVAFLMNAMIGMIELVEV